MRWLHRRVDDFMAFLMAVTFAIFILQIATRYLAKYQLASDFSWTLDLTSTSFLWIIFFGGAFALSESDHVKFDMVYNLFGVGMRRVMAVITSLSIVGLFAWSLPAVWKYLSFLHMLGKPNPTMKIPFSGGAPITISVIYSIYIVFALAIIWRYGSRAVRMLLGATPESLDQPAFPTGEPAFLTEEKAS